MCAEVQIRISRSTRSGAFAASHMPTMPPSETPQWDARSSSRRSIKREHVAPQIGDLVRPRRRGRPAVSAMVVADGPEARRERRLPSHISSVVPSEPPSSSTGASAGPETS